MPTIFLFNRMFLRISSLRKCQVFLKLNFLFQVSRINSSLLMAFLGEKSIQFIVNHCLNIHGRPDKCVSITQLQLQLNHAIYLLRLASWSVGDVDLTWANLVYEGRGIGVELSQLCDFWKTWSIRNLFLSTLWLFLKNHRLSSWCFGERDGF